MHISKNNSKREDWDGVRSWNYKLPHMEPSKSVVYAEIEGEHGEVETKETEWVYYIIEGNGVFTIAGEKTEVTLGDVITVPPHTLYNYKSAENEVLKVVMFIDFWDN